MTTETKPQKVECLNPNTGGRMNIDKNTYEVFAKAISYKQLNEGVQDCFKQKNKV